MSGHYNIKLSGLIGDVDGKNIDVEQKPVSETLFLKIALLTDN